MRYTDKNVSLHRRDDFVARDRMPTLIQLAILFLLDVVVVCGTYLLADSFLQFALITIIVLGIIDGIMVWSIQRSRDQMLVTEFQNALFASALSINNQFCLICRKDGVVVHTDVGFRSMFPQFERHVHRTLDDVFELAHVNREESDKIYTFLSEYSSGHAVITMRDENNQARRMFIYVDPIRRPHDYLLLRGRPYVEKRTEGAAAQ